jgi:hypothetical protein
MSLLVTKVAIAEERAEVPASDSSINDTDPPSSDYERQNATVQPKGRIQPLPFSFVLQLTCV